jgi:hypothetical protein
MEMTGNAQVLAVAAAVAAALTAVLVAMAEQVLVVLAAESYPAAGTGGAGGSAKAAYGSATDNAIDMGSGGGGGGGGGGGAAGGSNGGAGGSGGGAVSLKACNNLTVAGAVTANGTAGGAGGQGAALRDGSYLFYVVVQLAVYGLGVLLCRDNSACGAFVPIILTHNLVVPVPEVAVALVVVFCYKHLAWLALLVH